MHNLLDYASFPVFPNRMSKKQLQHFYKTVRLRTFAPNTPLTCQGQPADSYFVLFRGEVAVFRAGDR
jgi:CRP-like cAMP-binding protein